MNALVENKSFQEKMQERIRESIGDLITTEELKVLVDKGVHEAFFEKKTTKTGSGWNSQTVEMPSLMEAMVLELIQPLVLEECKLYLKEHSEEVQELIAKVVQEGVGAAIFKSMQSIFRNDLYGFEQRITDNLKNRVY